MKSIKMDPVTGQPIFPASVQMLVYCDGDRFYMRTKNRGILVKTGYRKRIRATNKVFDGIEYDWVCSGQYAEDIIHDNVRLKKDAGQVLYTNPKESQYWQVGGTVYKKLGKPCVERATKFCMGQSLRKMVTNSAEMCGNVFDEALPVFVEGKLEFEDLRTGRVDISGLTDSELETVLKILKREEKGAEPTWNPKCGYWDGDCRAKLIEAHLKAKSMTDDELHQVLLHYTERIDQVSALLKEHAGEFNFEDDGKHGLDCGFTVTAIVDPEYWDDYLLLVNDYRTRYKVPEVRMPKMAQSLTVQRREFAKAAAMAKRELGCRICILTSYLD